MQAVTAYEIENLQKTYQMIDKLTPKGQDAVMYFVMGLLTKQEVKES